MCVSKARIGTYICDLPASDMKAVDEALAKTVGLMGYHAALSKKLNDRSNYINRLKQERNTAQDTLAEICDLFQLGADMDIVTFLTDLKNNLDNLP